MHPLTLTGLAERADLATPDIGLETHTTDIVRLIETEGLHDVVLVGHSGGGIPTAQVADRTPERIARVVYVESGPPLDGASQLDIYPPEEQERLRSLVGDGHLLPPPSWESADDPVALAGLDAAALEMLRAHATPQPWRTATDPVRRTGRRAVPAALVACTFPLDVVRTLIAAEHPFFALLAGADLHALPTGHWPMLSEPARLADLLDRLAG